MASEVAINLYNFDDPCFNDNRYILTSPRSLEACHNLKIKPAELLPQPIDSYFQQLEPLGVAKHHIFAEYDAAESERRRKLQACRDERVRLIEEKQKKRRSISTSTSSGSVSVHESSHTLPQPIKSGVSFSRRVPRPKSANDSLNFNSLPPKDKKLIESMVSKRLKKSAWEAEDGDNTFDNSKYRQLIHRRTQKDLRKRLQEQAFNLEQMHFETAKRNLLAETTKSQNEAAVTRSRLSYSAKLQKKLENLEEDERRKMRLLEADKRSALESEQLEKNLSAREKTVTQNLNDLQSQKLRKIRERQRNFDQKLRHARRQKALVGASIDNWHHELLEQRNEAAKKAAKTQKASLIERQQRVREERESKAKALAENLRRLKLEEETAKRALEESIRKKEKRSRLLEMDKQKYMKQTRTLSQLSEKMRSEIRAKSETFDQKVAKAELEHRLVGTKIQPSELTSTKVLLNQSNVHLG